MIFDPDVQAFQKAWQIAAPIRVSERPNAAVQAALDRLARGVRKHILAGESDEKALKPFAAVVKKPELISDPGTLTLNSFRDGQRLLVDVSIGYASAVYAFGPDGQTLSLPAKLKWSYRYAGPIQRTGQSLMFDASSLQDLGVRYSFQLTWLRRTTQGYVATASTEGIYTLADDHHCDILPNRVVVRTLDDARTFFVPSPIRVMHRTETWSTTGPTPKRTTNVLGDLDVRAIDAWLWNHRGQRYQGRTLPKEPAAADNFRRKKNYLEFDLDDDRYGFTLTKTKSGYRVKSVKAL